MEHIVKLFKEIIFISFLLSALSKKENLREAWFSVSETVGSQRGAKSGEYAEWGRISKPLSVEAAIATWDV
jgi:hypothetical protein